MSKNEDQSIDLSEAWWLSQSTSAEGFGGFGVGISTRWIWRIYEDFFLTGGIGWKLEPTPWSSWKMVNKK